MEISPPPVTHVRVADPEQLVEGIRGADLEPCQLSHAPAPSELTRVLLPGACLDLARLGPAMLFSGATPRDCYTLIYVDACPQTGHSFNFGVDHHDGYIGFFPPGGALDAVTPAGYRNGTLTVPAADFHASFATHFPDAPDALFHIGAGLRVAPAAQGLLHTLLGAVAQMAADPAQPLADATVRQHAERDLRGAFFAALRSGSAPRSPQTSQRVARRHERLRKARDYLAAHAHEPVYVDDLCGPTGLTRRGLEMLFKEVTGLSPTAYLRHQRLHGARRALLHAAPAPGAVKQIALEWGFWHLGHFARDYSAFFGERPRETLARSD